MSLSITAVTDNPQLPGVVGLTYTPDQLIAGHKNLVTGNILLAAGTYVRGEVVGLQSTYPIDGVAATANTGNGTIGSLSTVAPKVGAYTLTATSETVFSVVNPEGTALADATVGTAYTSAEIDFLLTAGATAFVAGDVFTVNVFDAVGVYVKSVATATDGSQEPSALVVDSVTLTEESQVGAYLAGEFNIRSMTYDSSWLAATLGVALRKFGIFAKSSQSAAAPSNNSAP